MRKYICGDCGTVFNEDEADTRREKIGEFWGAPAYTNYNVCPRCKSDYVEEYISGDQEESDDD